LRKAKNIVGRFFQYFYQHQYWIRVVDWSKNHSLPGLSRVPIYNLIEFIDDEAKNDTLTSRANSMAFSFFLSLFPSIIVLFTLLAYTPLYSTFGDTLQKSISDVIPGSAGRMVFSTIKDIATIPRKGLLSAGFLLAMWFSSNGMMSLMRGMEKRYKSTFRKRTGWEKRFVALKLTFVLGSVLIASVVLVILGNTLLGLLFKIIKFSWFAKTILFAFRWIVILLLFYTGISLVYRFGAATRKPIPFLNPGSVLATLLSILSSWMFSFYVNNFGSYNKLYGSIGTLIVLMIWIQLNCFIILIGFELNAGIAVIRDRRRESQA
jgi:membrane protein